MNSEGPALPVARRFSFKWLRHFAADGPDLNTWDLAELLAAPARRTGVAGDTLEGFMIRNFNQQLYLLDRTWFEEGYFPYEYDMWFELGPDGVWLKLDRLSVVG